MNQMFHLIINGDIAKSLPPSGHIRREWLAIHYHNSIQLTRFLSSDIITGIDSALM